MPRATTMLMAWPHLLTRQLTALLTSRRLHTAEVPNTGAATSPIGTLGAVTRTSTRRSLMMTPGPSPTLLSPMTNGTTVMPTNGAARLGDATVTSTVPHPTVARPLLTNTTDTLRAARAAGPVANTPRADNSGLVHLPKALLLRLDTTTTPGPNRPTVRTSMPDGSRLMTISGLRTTIASTMPMPAPTARPPPSGLRVSPLARWDGPKEVSTTPPLALDTLETTANPDLTGMHG